VGDLKEVTRNELIKHLSSGNLEKGKFISKTLRGNTLWALYEHENKKYIIAYIMTSIRGSYEWEFIREEERDFSDLSCPLKYIQDSAIINSEWRKLAEYESEKASKNMQLIREMVVNKRKNQIVRIEITAKKGYAIKLHRYALEKAVLYIQKKKPLAGLFPKNGLMYYIPYRYVTDIKMIELKDYKEDIKKIEVLKTMPKFLESKCGD